MKPFRQDKRITLYNADCRDALSELADNSVDSVVTDPPYGLSFMGKKWDYDVPGVDIWCEVLRVLKPGGHMLCACGTRTQHRMVVNIEDAGFEIRDVVSWIYGSGFPKSLNVGKAIDKMLGNERDIVDRKDVGHDITGGGFKDAKPERKIMDITVGESEWEGWGTALKPACEFFTLVRKPLSEKTVAANVSKWGTGGINIDGCRVEGAPGSGVWGTSNETCQDGRMFNASPAGAGYRSQKHEQGRFPANLIHDGSQQVLDLFPDSKGQQGEVKGTEPSRTGGEGTNCYGEYGRVAQSKRSDSGSAARFFYCPKASKKDRNEGLDSLPEVEIKKWNERPGNRGVADKYPDGSPRPETKQRNTHPTVKPTALMRYLCRLITPPNGTVLDPFMGSGSTGKAAVKEGFRFVGIELEEKYCEIAKNRIVSQYSA